MPGDLPSKFTKLTLVPRDVRLEPLILARAKPQSVDDIVRRLEELSAAILKLGERLAVSSQLSEQNFRKLSSSLQATQDSLNSVIDHLTV